MKCYLFAVTALSLLLLAGCAEEIPTTTLQTTASLLPSRAENSNATSQSSTATNSGGTVAVESAEGYLTGEATHSDLIRGEIGDVVEINEKIFIAQTNDIYLNYGDYLGKTIKYEGLYQQATWATEDPEIFETFHYVIRYGPGCCGTDGNAGFEVVWDGDWPEEDDWVAAVGSLELYENNGWSYLQLRLESLTVLEVRGREYVSQ